MNQPTTEPYHITKNQQNNIARGIARYYDIKSITFLTSERNRIAGSIHVIVEINNDPNLENDIPYLELDRLDNPNLQNTLIPLNEYAYLERTPTIPADSPVDLSHVKITYLKQE